MSGDIIGNPPGEPQEAACLPSKKSHPRLYNVWAQMVSRCHNARNHYYPFYGGRGIAVCDRWRKSFADFLADMGEPPTAKHTLDRHPDNDGPYAPENVRWATRLQQARNTRYTRMATFQGVTLSLCEWAERIGMSPSGLARRVSKGWSEERILTPPFRGH